MGDILMLLTSAALMLRCVAACCNVLQWCAVGCSGLQCVAVCRSVIRDLILRSALCET